MSTPTLDTAHALAARAARRHGFSDRAQLHLVKHRENHVYRLVDDDREYALRLHRSGYHDLGQVEAEVAVLAELGRAGIPVPVVVPAAGGGLVTVVTDDDGVDHLADVQEWITGSRPLGSVEEALDGTAALEPADFTALGAATAALHAGLARIDTSRSARGSWDVAGLCGPGHLWGDPCGLQSLTDDERAVLTAALDRLRTDLGRLDAGAGAFGLVHADLTPENVLVDAGGNLVLIDFDDSGHGWYLFDLATVLFFYLPHPRHAEYRAALLAGYRSVRPLDDAELEPLDALVLARGTTYLAWAAARRGDEAAEHVVQVVAPRVLALAREYLADRP